MSGGDPRGIDPSGAESDEEEVARTQGSSTSLADDEEREGRDEASAGGGDDAQAALDAMPASDGTEDDQVVSREPDSQDHEG